MTYKVYGIGAVAVIALIVALAYNPTETFDLDTEQSFIISTYQQSAQWDWIKGQVENAEETTDIIVNSNDIITNTNDISSLEDRINKISSNVSNLNNKVTLLEQEPAPVVVVEAAVDEITDLYTTDNDSDREDRFAQGDIMYFYVVIDTTERYLYYEIVNDDTNATIKDKRITISPNIDHMVWAWAIPATQTLGDYYIEVDVGDTTEVINFDIR
jgi:hypothetical protein